MISEVNSVFYKHAQVFNEFRSQDQNAIREQMQADLDPNGTFVKLETIATGLPNDVFNAFYESCLAQG